jgi:hypothetical protein
MRCDVNVSVRPKGREKFGTKVGVSFLAEKWPCVTLAGAHELTSSTYTS